MADIGKTQGTPLNNKLYILAFGRADFEEGTEYQGFQYKFLIFLMLAGAVLTALLVMGSLARLNPIDGPHLIMMNIFTLTTLVLWAVIRGRPQKFLVIAWFYEGLCLIEYASAFIFVPFDELRILWYLVNIPGVFILLGRQAGWAITLLSIATIAIINPQLATPYSDNAMATLFFSLLYLAIMFHAFVDKSMSYFLRMVDYNQKLQIMALQDPLTGVHNARAFYQSAEVMIQACYQQQALFAVLFIDLDHFKSINDTYGHHVGDKVLTQVASVLQGGVRQNDILGRIGGEEFAIVLPNANQADACLLAEALRSKIESTLIETEDGQLAVTASIGVSVAKSGSQEPLRVIQEQADQAMYHAKQAGRNLVSVL